MWPSQNIWTLHREKNLITKYQFYLIFFDLEQLFFQTKRQEKLRKYSVTIIVRTFHWLNNLLLCIMNFSTAMRPRKMNLKNITNSLPLPSILKTFFSTHFFWPQYLEKFKNTPEQIFLAVGKNNYGNKIPFPESLWISLARIIIRAPSIPPFKGLEMRSLQYEIRICQKNHNECQVSLKLYASDIKSWMWSSPWITQFGRTAWEKLRHKFR